MLGKSLFLNKYKITHGTYYHTHLAFLLIWQICKPGLFVLIFFVIIRKKLHSDIPVLFLLFNQGLISLRRVQEGTT